jgi:hypothetical protein
MLKQFQGAKWWSFTLNMAANCRVLPAMSLPPKNGLFILNHLLTDENPHSSFSYVNLHNLRVEITASKLVLLLYSCIYHIFGTKIGTHGWMRGWSI